MGGIGKFQLEVADMPTIRRKQLNPWALPLYNERLAAFCKKQNIKCVDIASYLPRDTSIFSTMTATLMKTAQGS